MEINPKRTFRYYALRFRRLGGDPKSLALGTAVGIFIGLTPTVPLHTVVIIAITLLTRANTIAALISATIVSNPLTFVPVYFLCWKIGNFILPHRLTWTRMQEVLAVFSSEGFLESLRTVSGLSLDAILVMITGGLLLALPAALISYYFSLLFFIKLREKRRQKHLLN
ncbi:MAG: DUF2062 domain-containing protein [Desulfobulbaceae bacterium]|nr:DUF2062 domain-containing protein [Desulfobulbaceae bacterium]